MTPSGAIQQDKADRADRKAAAAWLDGQVSGSEQFGLLGLNLLDALALIAFLLLTAQALVGIALPEQAAIATESSLIILAVLALIRFLFRSAAEQSAARLAETVGRRLHRQALDNALDPAFRFSTGQGNAEIGSDLSESLQAIGHWYREHLSQRLLALCQPLLVLLIVFSLDWLAGALLLLAAPLIPLFSALIGLGTASLVAEQQDRLRRLSGHFLDRVRALQTLRLFGQEQAEGTRVGQAAMAYRDSSMQVLRIAFLSSAVLEFFSAVAIASLAVYVGLALLGYIDYGPASDLGFVAGLSILMLAPEFFQPLRKWASAYHERAAAIAAAPRLQALVSGGGEIGKVSPQRTRQTNTANNQTGTSPDIDQGPIELDIRSLGLGWPGNERPLFSNLDLSLPAGEWLLIQGTSGSGKSTLAALVMGWLQAQEGQIRLAGQPLDHWPESTRRHRLAWLGQNPGLMPASLRLNLDPGRRFDDDTLYQALTAQGLGALANQLPGGLAGQIGERGSGISGGEAQRLALARALLNPVGLMVLDEPTASLDPDNARRVLEQLKSRQGELSILMFSHDPTVTNWADRCLTLREGQLHAQ